MVSLWPFRRASTSAESFEKTLSALATKISKQGTRNDRLRQRARRVKVSWTLYGGFAYILAGLLLIFVTGQANWGVVEYSILAGGPVLLYLVRTTFDIWYNYRISSSQDYLDSLYKERDATIEKLKEATKYNSTEQLLKKYGSPRPSTLNDQSDEAKDKYKSSGSGMKNQGDRIFISPPPTANIQRSLTQAKHSSASQQAKSPIPAPPSHFPQHRSLNPQDPPHSAEFAPNAFDHSQQYSSAPSYGESRWYDRILDALLGEDEMQAKNRFALICQNCRLINGQAPPGARTLEDVGKWRCQGCGSMNGVENEAEKLVKQASRGDVGSSNIPGRQEEYSSEDDENMQLEDEREDIVEDSEEEAREASPALSTGSKSTRKT